MGRIYTGPRTKEVGRATSEEREEAGEDERLLYGSDGSR
jgi:hypothetical protein